MVRMSCQLAVTLTANRLSQSFGLDMAERGRHAEHAGIADQDVEAAVTFVEREREPGDAVRILHVERHQRCRAALGLDLVIELFQPADRPRHRHHMRAGLRQFERQRRANTARGAGDQRDTVGQGSGHVLRQLGGLSGSLMPSSATVRNTVRGQIRFLQEFAA